MQTIDGADGIYTKNFPLTGITQYDSDLCYLEDGWLKFTKYGLLWAAGQVYIQSNKAHDWISGYIVGLDTDDKYVRYNFSASRTPDTVNIGTATIGNAIVRITIGMKLRLAGYASNATTATTAGNSYYLRGLFWE